VGTVERIKNIKVDGTEIEFEGLGSFYGIDTDLTMNESIKTIRHEMY
jgi:hypothetical protein